MELTHVVILRIIALAVLLYTSFSVTYQSVVAAVCFIGTLVVLKPEKRIIVINKNNRGMKNPLKGKPQCTELKPELAEKVNKAIADLVTYDAEEADSLKDFNVVKANTECIFAKRSKIWGTPSWENDLSIEENIFKILPTFLKFTMCCEALGLDGFLIQMPHKYAANIKTFGSCVRRILRAISKWDPRGLDCMRHTSVERIGWVFRFHTETFFTTTFAPCYPITHSRYNFGSQYGYILFQPEISFAQHNIPDDSPNTDWNRPANVRDRIRVAFKEAGREYRIRQTINFPMAYELVKPVDDFDTDFFEWWNATDQEEY